MASPETSTPSLTPSRSVSPEPPAQPDHFYGIDNPQLPTPHSDGRAWLNPADDPLAQRGIPVFKPTMDEFRDFEGYMNRVECWGMRSGIVKIIPPKEWTDALPSVVPQLANAKVRNPIEQHMFGRGGLFRQENIEKRRIMSVREWAELCSKEDLRAPGVDDMGLHARATNGSARTRTRRGRTKTREPATAEPEMTPEIRVKEEHMEDEGVNIGQIDENERFKTPALTPPRDFTSSTPVPGDTPSAADPNVQTTDLPSSRQASVAVTEDFGDQEDVKPKRKRNVPKEVREAHMAERLSKDKQFLEGFDPHSDWLPPNTTGFDYTPEFCKELERRYWRNCGLGKSAWYGADLQGSLFTDETTSWNVAHLQSALTRLLPASAKGLPGVNTPYLYFGMWRATFAWHVEDMDLFSINYIHFGAPKFWYAVPQARATALEQAMKGYFPRDIAQCPQFLRHKSFLASPTLLSQSSCRPNCLVQHEREFVITYPRGYHAGFNLGFNCAESVNFALESWINLGRKAKACECVNFSVRIDVDQLIADREAERAEERAQKEVEERKEDEETVVPKPKPLPRKRKSEPTDAGEPKPKKAKVKPPKATVKPPVAGPSSSPSSSKLPIPKLTLKLAPPKPKEPEGFPCCLCVSQKAEGLLKVQDPPTWRKEGESGLPGKENVWMAHEECASIVPETWVDEIESGALSEDGIPIKEKVVFGVGGIVKDRWNLKCTACVKTKHKAHGAPIQCTKGKCPKAFHVSCARDGGASGIVFRVIGEVEKDVVLSKSPTPDPVVEEPVPMAVDPPGTLGDEAPADGTPPETLETGLDVIKVIKKTEIELLCSQHNPAIAAAKKNQKQEKIKNDLLALPPMSRIKLRNSAGVFEVSLVRVIPEIKSVEVLWDRGVKREFKWGCVVFGATEGVVGQKPSEVAVEVEPPPSVAPVPQLTAATFPSHKTTPTTDHHRQIQPYPTASTSYQPPRQQPSQYTSHPPYPYSQPGWGYPYQNSAYPQPQALYPHPHYQPQAGPSYPGSSSQAPYGGYTSSQNFSGPCAYQPQGTLHPGLQWKAPYAGPRHSTSGTPTPTYTPASLTPPVAQSYSRVPSPLPPTDPARSASKSEPPVIVSPAATTAEVATPLASSPKPSSPSSVSSPTGQAGDPGPST